jgi:hypothetical protein
MKQITIRGIPSEVEKAIRNESKRKGLSLNKVIISFLERTIGIQKKKAAKPLSYHDLDNLAGAWSKTEADEFERNLKDQRQIDEDIWR